jgi:hypothetical protein
MRYQGQPRADWEIRQGVAKQVEIASIEAGKPQGDGPPPVLPVAPPDTGHHDATGATAAGE